VILTPGRGGAGPLGAQIDLGGVHFALVAPGATAVDLCLFDAAGVEQLHRIAMPAFDDGVWHGHLAGAGPGLVYGWRVAGPWQPHRGQRFNPAKLLLDPYAREVVGRYDGSDLFLGHDEARPWLADPRDNGRIALKARVVADPPALSVADHCHVAASDAVVYEAHLRNLTMRHPEVPPAIRGTYAGMAHPAVLAHLRALGITSVSLMPLQHRADEVRLLRMGLANHWGYSPIAWLAPEARYASPGGSAVAECRAMVAALHAAGFEVILDVVFNHSAETDEFGPTLSLRGIANDLYYRLSADDPARYENWTGCGNCLDLTQPAVLRLVMDALRWWAGVIGIDGFRFDLATVLGRGSQDGSTAFSRRAAFLAAVAQDPLLARTRLIAEPWDIGPGGYRLGGYPPGWLEWNDRYRDTVRRFWLLRDLPRAAFVDRFAGSADAFAHDGRSPAASVNLITAHDGFTLHDLVSYRERRNAANGENNRDGHGDNHSVDCGAPGPTDDAQVVALRLRLRRALLATLLLSIGTPMLLSGDEIGHSQRGNNNAYCQDNEITWLDWPAADLGLAEFVGRCIRLRRAHPALRRHRWLTDADVSWRAADGRALAGNDWHDPLARDLAIHLADPPTDLLLLINAGDDAVRFALPPGAWTLALTSDAEPPPASVQSAGITVPARCLWALEAVAAAAV
jgi:glycogen operon protein